MKEIAVAFQYFVSEFSTTLLLVTCIYRRWTALRIDKENGENGLGVPKDGLVYISTTEEVSKYNKMAVR
jgi:hypothetical protein